jgi:hypothetical protein
MTNGASTPASMLSLLHFSENPLKSAERVKGIEPSFVWCKLV